MTESVVQNTKLPGDANHMGHKGAIPLFDLDRAPGVDEIRAACLGVGCFNITNAGLDGARTAALLKQMACFFDLADDHPVKREAHRDRNEGASGWTPTLEEPAYEAGTIAWVESFDCGLSRETLARLPAHLGAGSRASIWPRLPNFREVVRGHWDVLITAANRVFPLISLILKQDPGFLSGRASSQALNTLRLLNYPRNPGFDSRVNQGISAHTDFECITLIHQTAPGLEVQTPSGEWLSVPVADGQWTVLIGDMIERWSNGTFRATPHRVPATAWPRRSIVMFLAADPGLEVTPLEAFVDAANPPRYQVVTQDGQIREAMARAEVNRQAMLPQVEKLRGEISPG
jgi:isopenicillin N synthase-like dioxygenase